MPKIYISKLSESYQSSSSGNKMPNVAVLLLCVSITFIDVIADQVQFETVYEWKYIDYEWENANHKEAAIASGDYNHTKPIIIDTDHSKGNIIIST